MSTTDDTRRHLAEIEAREQAATKGPWMLDGNAEIKSSSYETLADVWEPTAESENGEFIANARTDVPWMANLLRQYVGVEPTRDEELEHAQRCLNAVCDLIDEAKRQATRWENPLPVPEWVEALERAAEGDRPAPADNRRRIYSDGQGHAWIDHYRGEDGTQYVTSITDPWRKEQTDHDVRTTTGGLREIGRTW